MTDFRHRLRFSLVALAAVVGVLSVVSDVSASTVNTASRNGARACCLKRACAVCCCEPASPSLAGRPIYLESDEAGFTERTAPPCECRSGDPAAPAPKPGTRIDHHRVDRPRGGPVVLTLEVPSANPFARLIKPASRLSQAPLHLRTTRLLI